MSTYGQIRYTGIIKAIEDGIIPAGAGLDLNTVNTASVNAVEGNRYIIIYGGSTTVILPSNPQFNDQIGVVVSNGLLTNVIDRNGNKIQGVSDNLTLDINNAAFDLVYIDSTYGWRII